METVLFCPACGRGIGKMTEKESHVAGKPTVYKRRGERYTADCPHCGFNFSVIAGKNAKLELGEPVEIAAYRRLCDR
jgi:hypothetical protein